MRTFEEAVPRSFALVDGRWVHRFGPDQAFSLELEPILGGGWLVALYGPDPAEHVPGHPGSPWPRLLLADKIPVRAVIRGDGGGSAPDVAIAAAMRFLNRAAGDSAAADEPSGP